jgi:hypothetical protein
VKPPRLCIVAGLDGSGKSMLLCGMEPKGGLVLDDIMKHAVGDEPRFDCCRHRKAILEALDAGSPLMLADSLFCDPDFRWGFMEALAGRVAPEEIDWIWFEPDVRACEANIRHRAKKHGWNHPEIPMASNPDWPPSPGGREGEAGFAQQGVGPAPALLQVRHFRNFKRVGEGLAQRAPAADAGPGVAVTGLAGVQEA